MICIKLITNGTMNLMALSIKEIKELITSLIPDATIEIKDLVGDSNHYSAKITSKIFNGKTKIEQHKLGL